MFHVISRVLACFCSPVHSTPNGVMAFVWRDRYKHESLFVSVSVFSCCVYDLFRYPYANCNCTVVGWKTNYMT